MTKIYLSELISRVDTGSGDLVKWSYSQCRQLEFVPVNKVFGNGGKLFFANMI